jgi:hypothetical protein
MSTGKDVLEELFTLRLADVAPEQVTLTLDVQGVRYTVQSIHAETYRDSRMKGDGYVELVLTATEEAGENGNAGTDPTSTV